MARHSRTVFEEPPSDKELAKSLSSVAAPLHGWEDLDPLIDRVGDARVVMLGEASHGTAEFYEWRRVISQRLLREKDFSFIAVEGDWPDCYRVNRYVKGYPDSGAHARDVLHAFGRWPTWMWANAEVVRLMEWLREFNRDLAEGRRAGFYGLDVYSLWESMDAVLDYLGGVDGDAVTAARRAFACFEPYDYDAEQYARTMLWAPKSCEDDVVALLRALRDQDDAFDQDEEAHFNAEQNALVIQHAEEYYRTMIGGAAPSWTIRDRHMMETLNRLLDYHGPQAKAIVWAHNTHVGDARFTDMAGDHMVNIGQLAREEHGTDRVVLVGFSTYAGTVIAAEEWGAARQVMRVPSARPGSWEAVLHEQAADDALLIFDRYAERGAFAEPRGHRAIGVVYRPEFEAYGNYVPTIMPRRYDVLAFLDQTHAILPLGVPASFEHEVPETFPSGV